MLEENYYLANFLSLLAFVRKTYSGLLNDKEKLWHDEILAAGEAAQRLYVRLSNRRASAFRIGKLRYTEIGSIEEAACELQVRALADTNAPADLADLLPAFTKPELIKLLGLQNQRQVSRAQLEQHVIERQNLLDTQILQQADKWVSVLGLDAYAVYKLCFFGNCYQDMSEFVLRDLGVFNYEQYVIDAQSRVFQSREQLDAHLQYFSCVSAFEQLDQTDTDALLALNTELPPTNANDPHLIRRVDRLRNTIARQLERLDEPQQALSLYRCSAKPPSRERQVRLLMKLDRYADAQQLCDLILAKPVASEESQFVETISPKLHKKLGMTPPKKSTFRPVTSKLTLSSGDARVEMIARDFYAQFGDCFYVENSLVNGVLGLFIWDIIFAPKEGVFYNPFQSAPADFYQPDFTRERSDMLERRFDELRDPLRFSATVWETYESKKGLMNPLVNWQALSEELLSMALIRIPTDDWRVLFERILLDIRNHTSGLPDLILFPRVGSYEMLEIKGPGDAIQKNQRRWMAYFFEHRIPYRVVHIRWAKQASSV